MKTKWNVMDTLLVLAIAAVFAVGVWFLAGRGGGQAAVQDKTVEVMIELTKKDEAFTKLPKVGDTVTLGVKEKMPATVTKVEILPAVTQGKDMLNGKFTEEPIPELYHVQITVEGTGTESASTVEINGNPLRVGAESAIKSKNWVGYGFILAVETRD